MSGGRTLRIGLTGPIGCGKSTIAGWLGELGATIIDADAEARRATPRRSRALAAVVREFGAGVLYDDGRLDRAALAAIVFAEPAALARLEAIIHPAVRRRILGRMAAAEHADAPAIVVEAIKLVEGGLAQLCDEVWLVSCQPAIQRRRLAVRGASPRDTEARIVAQAYIAERLRPHATRVIETSGSEAATRRAVGEAYAAAIATGAGRARS